MVLQIMHTGRIAHPLNRRIPDAPVAPSAVKPSGQIWTDQAQMQNYPEPRALDTAELPALVEEHVAAARNAIAAGFDGVELHAANGYLLNQFLASNSNVREDGYGGSVDGRIRFVVEVVEAVAAAIGAQRTAIRVSPGHMFNDIVDANPLETHRALLDALPTGRMAYVHVMLPDAFSPQLNNAGDPQALLPALRPHVKGALLAAGQLTAESAQALIDSGMIQVAVFGRPFIANPDLVERLKTGAELAQPKASLFYTPGPEGYSDYPRLVPEAPGCARPERRSAGAADHEGGRDELVQQRHRRLRRGRERVELGVLAVLQQQRRVHLVEVHLAHRPVAEAPLADLLEAQDAHVLVAAIAHDRVVELADLVASTLQHLDERVLAVAQHAGDAASRVVGPRLLEDRVVDGGGQRRGGAAGVEQTYEHGGVTRSGRSVRGTRGAASGP